MKYFECRPIRMLGCLVLITMAGCSFVPQQPVTEPSVPVNNLVLETLPEEKNPYRIDRKKVSKRAKQRFAQAIEAIQNQDWLQAEEHLIWLSQEYPRYSGPLVNLAALYRETGKPKESESAYRQAISANPNNLDAYNELAILLREQGRFQEAEEQYRQAIAVWADYPQTHLNLGILYDLYMGRFNDALHHYQRFQELQTEPDRKVAGWIADLQRRADQIVAGAGND